MKHQAYILLGSNLGDRTQHLQQARAMLELNCGKLLRESSIYESPPWGFDAEQSFLNQVLKIETDQSPAELLTRLLSIEKQMGRERNGSTYSSRIIDLDILYYESLVLNEPLLSIPHPRLHLRRFTLLPLAEIAADFVHPLLKLTNAELLKKTVDFSEVKPFKLIA
jgi:2-amino-4-hydroxy-6-hydroxymethyldihydropteridine diphosphokinase